MNTYDVIRLVGSVWPLLYGLPKTHKVNVLLSPNMSIVGLAQQKLANGSNSHPIMLSHIVDNTFCVFDNGEQWGMFYCLLNDLQNLFSNPVTISD